MNRNTKAIIAVLISIIIITAGILIIRESMIQNSKPSQLPPFPPYDFNAGTMRSGNAYANITGSATAFLYSQNNGQGMFLHFYPSPGRFVTVCDKAFYNESAGIANECVNFSSFVVNVHYILNPGNFTEIISIFNRLPQEQQVSMGFNAEFNKIANITLSQGNPNNPVNTTINPEPYNFTENYNLHNSCLFAAAWGSGVNITLNWYSMEGILAGGELTFNGFHASYTSLGLAFSGIGIPPDSNLTLGEITASY
ncbi:MAG: hypothetical protein M1306_06180 [Candidatus Thermoplasmatota archaeon]|jgi:hypothetical protein|nr:hypothetical protein [Candidatus Thermoplasmatota archaeon]